MLLLAHVQGVCAQMPPIIVGQIGEPQSLQTFGDLQGYLSRIKQNWEGYFGNLSFVLPFLSVSAEAPEERRLEQ